MRRNMILYCMVSDETPIEGLCKCEMEKISETRTSEGSPRMRTTGFVDSIN